jgi:hypothetical protein
VKLAHRRQGQVQLVTEAQRPMSQDIAYRERRYLIMMGVRVVCFIIAVIMFTAGAGWLTAIPAVGAIAIPYFAVVFANGGREPSGGRFQPFEPRLPARNGRPDSASGDGQNRTAGTGMPGEPGHPSDSGSCGVPPQTG